MGYDIPEPYCWDESFCVFYASIDEQHKQIFNCIFDCAGDRNNSDKVKSLLDVTEKHFTHEEGMMTDKNYEGLADHKTIHAGFVLKLKGLKTPLDDATVNWAKDWLVGHIKGIDFKYKGKL